MIAGNYYRTGYRMAEDLNCTGQKTGSIVFNEADGERRVDLFMLVWYNFYVFWRVIAR